MKDILEYPITIYFYPLDPLAADGFDNNLLEGSVHVFEEVIVVVFFWYFQSATVIFQCVGLMGYASGSPSFIDGTNMIGEYKVYC